jgi:endonuclease YncB( thermonuclease family)
MWRFAAIAILVIGISLLVAGEAEPTAAHHGEGYATVLYVIDGDTFDIARGRGTERVRLFGANAPEAGTACGDAATRILRSWLAETGNRVYLELGPRSADNGGRALYYVWQVINREWFLIDDDLVYEGYAYAWVGEGQYSSDIVASERSARLNRRGCLW